MFDRSWITRRFFVLVGMLVVSMFSYYAGTLIVDRKCPSIVQPSEALGSTLKAERILPKARENSPIKREVDDFIYPRSIANAQILPKITTNNPNERSVADSISTQFIRKPRKFNNVKENHPDEAEMHHTVTNDVYTGSAVAGENYSVVPYDFYRAVTSEEMLTFLDLLVTLDRVARKYNITMFMNYGTLLGSFRHHAIVPWDDDCDVAMPYDKKYTILYLLRNLHLSPYSLPELARSANDTGGYYIEVTADTQFRFTSGRSRFYRPGWPFRWPYIDIDLYFENDTSIWTSNSNVDYIHPRDVVFPLHLRPLGSIWLPAPRDSHRFMVETFKDVGLCATGMQHKVGKERRVRKRPCESLKEAYPFVHRSLTRDGGVLETLKLNEKVLYSIVVDEPLVTASVDPFTFKRQR